MEKRIANYEIFQILIFLCKLIGAFNCEYDVEIVIKQGTALTHDGGNSYVFLDPRDYKKSSRKMARTICHLAGFLKNRGVYDLEMGDKYIFVNGLVYRVVHDPHTERILVQTEPNRMF